MNRLIESLQQKDTYTANGAVTHSSSLNPLVDLFFIAGASRNMPEEDIISLFHKAWVADMNLTAKLIFWARDIRGGAGERRFFRICMKEIQKLYKDGVYDQLAIHIPEYGYWKDVFELEEPDPNNLDWVYRALVERNDGLCAKWFPRKGKWFDAMYKHVRYTPKELRKLIVGLSNTVETQMCAKQWDNINYSHVPSIAAKKYVKAFLRNDQSRYSMFMADAAAGKEKVNSGALFPYDIYKMFKAGNNSDTIRALWQNLPDYMAESDERILPVCDTSGSMLSSYGKNTTLVPMDISVSLGVYISERNKGPFKDAFITFSETPTLQYLSGDVINRFSQLQTAKWGYNTNLQAVFHLILERAVEENIPEEEMPTTILIISDMEFDEACKRQTNLEAIRQGYINMGYDMPKIAFWNVHGRMGNVPASVKDSNVALISGASPAIVQSVLGGEDFSPVSIMLKTLNSIRYRQISID